MMSAIQAAVPAQTIFSTILGLFWLGIFFESWICFELDRFILIDKFEVLLRVLEFNASLLSNSYSVCDSRLETNSAFI